MSNNTREVKNLITQLEDAVKQIEYESNKDNFIPCSFCKRPVLNKGKFRSYRAVCGSFT